MKEIELEFGSITCNDNSCLKISEIEVRTAPVITPAVIEGKISTNQPNTDGQYNVIYEPVTAGNYALNVIWRRAGGLLAKYYENEDFSVPYAPVDGLCPLDIDTVVASYPSLLTQKRMYDGVYRKHIPRMEYWHVWPGALCSAGLRI